MENIAIDLLWLRPGKVGGTESYIRNLLDGFMELQEQFMFTLLVSKDNAYSFKRYEEDARYHILIAGVDSANIAKRIIWQNLNQNRFLRKKGIRKCFEPVYCKPWLNGGIDYTCVIHDLQAYHYPQYHPLHEVIYSRLCWRMDIWNAARIISISNWVKKDIEEKYKRKDIQVIYNPVLIKSGERISFETVQEKYRIKQNGFFYTVTQLIPHKNIETLILVIEKIIRENINLPDKLVISGVNGNAALRLNKMIEEKNLTGHILLTGYVSNEIRNALYENCHTFLFPSIFEGFGMPPVEAMYYGARVVTTSCTSIEEVTQKKAVYVKDPFDAEEWIEKIKDENNRCGKPDFSIYDFLNISKQYLKLLKEPEWKKK